MRRLLLLVAALLTGLALLTPAPAGAAEGEPDPEDQLAQRFAPVMMLVHQDEACGPGEPYQPSAVDPLFDDDGVALRGPWGDDDLVAVAPGVDTLAAGLRDYALDLPGDPLDPGCTYEKWADRVWGADAAPTIYAHVATEKGRPGRIALQYLFYYPFNDYNNKHESDWERIQLEFAADDAEAALQQVPDTIVYAQHYGSERATWDDDKLEVADETHPVVYVSAGSHASQYGAGLYLGNSASTGFGCDTTVGPHDEVRPTVLTIPSDPEAAAERYPWIGYEGHWGERGPRRFYTGPTGPNRKLFWTRPFTWSDGSRAHSYPVPGGGTAGGTATSFFCDAVGGGSDVFRRYVADPAPLLALLAAGALGLVWLLRRTAWRSPPVPAAGRRSGGEVVAATLGLARAHPRLFAGLATWPTVLMLGAAVLQASSTTVAVPLVLRVVVDAAALLGLVVSAGATAQAVGSLDGAEPVSAARAYRHSLARQPVAVVTVALGALVVLLLSGTLVLLPVAVLIAAAFTYAVPVAHLEGHWGPRGLLRSIRLARRSWRTLLPLFALALVVALLVGLLLAAGIFVVLTAPFVVVNAVPPLVTALLWPVVCVMIAYAYLDAVATSEGAGDAA